MFTIDNEGNMSVKKSFKFIIAGSVISLLAFFTWVFLLETVVVDPGEEVVLVDRPYIFKFAGEGVRKEPIKEGRAMIFVTTKAYSVSVVPVSKSIGIDDFSTQDRFLLDFESNIQYRVTDTVRLIDRFGPDWFKNNIHAQYLGIVRSSVKKYDMRAIMSDTHTAEKLDDDITKETRELVKLNNIPIEIINITLGRAKPNSEVISQMNQTAAQKERENTLIAQETAEKQRDKTEQARADADNAYRNKLGMSTDQFVQLEVARTYAGACMKAGTCFVINGNVPSMTLPIK